VVDLDRWRWNPRERDARPVLDAIPNARPAAAGIICGRGSVTDKLFDSIQNAAGQLPEGWIIDLCVERGAGWVELYDPDGDRHELGEMPDASLAEEVDAAVAEAQRASGMAPSPTPETPVEQCGAIDPHRHVHCQLQMGHQSSHRHETSMAIFRWPATNR
jgi:hypothetical protein